MGSAAAGGVSAWGARASWAKARHEQARRWERVARPARACGALTPSRLPVSAPWPFPAGPRCRPPWFSPQSPNPVGPGSSQARLEQGTSGCSSRLIFILRFLLPFLLLSVRGQTFLTGLALFGGQRPLPLSPDRPLPASGSPECPRERWGGLKEPSPAPHRKRLF